MNSAMESAYSSSLASPQSSRSHSPLPHMQAPNPYRLPRFWRGFALGGLTTAGAYGLYKLGSYIKDRLFNKFHRQPTTEYIPYTYQPTPTATPKPEPTPYRRRNIKMQYNRHF